MKSITVIIAIFSFTFTTQSQDCDCQSDFNFMADTYLADYSGMRDFAARNPGYLSHIDSL